MQIKQLTGKIENPKILQGEIIDSGEYFQPGIWRLRAFITKKKLNLCLNCNIYHENNRTTCVRPGGS